jgi:tetratricopeptide (TPR) repeat protein
MTRLWLALLFLPTLPFPIPAQEPAATASTVIQKPADYSHEPFVIEQYFTTARFENDGTGLRDIAVKVRVQTDAGVQELSEIVFPYNAANEQMDIRYVRVRKRDGTTATIGPDAVKELLAPVVRDAVAYSDCKEKHISVPALAPGDTLEYEIATRVVTPPAPGEFWFQHSFLTNVIVLDERFEVNAPASRKIILKSPAPWHYETVTANDRHIYRWKHSNLTHAASDPSKKESEQANENPPDVQLTTFATWQEVARWYANLAQGRADSSPEIRAKTQELMQSRASEIDKEQAIYDFVSKEIRSVDLPFGTGPYRPHRAAEIFANRYGDSKDKHILLAAMLHAAGIPSEAVLISYRRKLDASFPSPTQFDHVVTVVPQAGESVWMDSTPQVAPFRLLASPLRDKSALLVPPDGIGRIVRTPADPPFASTQVVDIDGTLSDLGKLTAHANYTLRGDTELVLRLAFHKTPQSQWNELGQTILGLDGLHGEVSVVQPSNPFDTHNPFTLDIAFTQSNFIGWSARKSKPSLPLLVIGLPDAPAGSSKPIDLGSPLNVTVSLKLALPEPFAAQPPVATSLTRDYAAYNSSYKYADHIVTAERSLNFKVRELPAARAGDYAAFTQAVAKDQIQPLTIENIASGAPAIPASATTDELLEAGLAAFNSGNAPAAIPLFQRVTTIDPRNKNVWNDLGLANLRIGNYDAAIAAFGKQLEINPADEHANDYLGLALEQMHNYPEAAAAFRKQVELNPLDTVAHAALGEILLDQHEFAAAVPELEKAAILSPENAGLRVGLGRAYLNVSQDDKALLAFEAAAQLSPTAGVWNDIAFNLADKAVYLDKAQHYAQTAVSTVEADLAKSELSQLTPTQLDEVANLGAYWDTLGWVYFRQGDLALAQRYVRAAWLLDQAGEIGDHLAEVDEKLGQKDRAIHEYSLALAAPDAIPETRAKLTLLLGGNAQIENLVNQAKPELAKLREIPAGKLLREDAQADFLLLLSPVGKSAQASAVRFVGGSEKLRLLADRLRSLDYGTVFPDGAPVKLVRRGTMACSANTGDCILTLIRPEEVSAIYKKAQ